MTTTRPTAPRVLAALVTGVATTAYYASPDVIRSRTARGWVKVALSAALVATSVPDLRAALATRKQAHATAPRLHGTALPDGTGLDATAPVARAVDENRTSDDATAAPRDLRPALVAGGVAAAAIAVSTVGTVAFERWVFRRGERLLAAGRPLAHTRAAIVLGVVMTALSLIPDPTDD